jgi:hypothetical protein
LKINASKYFTFMYLPMWVACWPQQVCLVFQKSLIWPWQAYDSYFFICFDRS